MAAPSRRGPDRLDQPLDAVVAPEMLVPEHEEGEAEDAIGLGGLVAGGEVGSPARIVERGQEALPVEPGTLGDRSQDVLLADVLRLEEARRIDAVVVGLAASLGAREEEAEASEAAVGEGTRLEPQAIGGGEPAHVLKNVADARRGRVGSAATGAR